MSDWSSDVCSSDLFDVTSLRRAEMVSRATTLPPMAAWMAILKSWRGMRSLRRSQSMRPRVSAWPRWTMMASESPGSGFTRIENFTRRSEDHTSELQSLMRRSYAVFLLKKKKSKIITQHSSQSTTQPKNTSKIIQQASLIARTNTRLRSTSKINTSYTTKYTKNISNNLIHTNLAKTQLSDEST